MTVKFHPVCAGVHNPLQLVAREFLRLGDILEERKSVVAEDLRGCAGIVWGGHRWGLQCVASLKTFK